MDFKDHFSGHADRYTKYRPRYPRELFAHLAALAPRRNRAWDCGTGNGQAAVALADYFQEVIATDASANQIAMAEVHAKVRYVVAPAESSGIDAASVALITVAQALHWFDFERFYAEVRRVACPQGVLAAWSYGGARITPAIDRVVGRLYSDIVGPYWPPERMLVERRYADIPFPFDEISMPEFSMTARWNLPDLVGYLGTWSSVERYKQQHAADPLVQIEADLRAAWGPPDTERPVSWPLFFRVGRIS